MIILGILPVLRSAASFRALEKWFYDHAGTLETDEYKSRKGTQLITKLQWIYVQYLALKFVLEPCSQRL